MSIGSPLVTVLIATKDRPDDLRRTLRQLRDQLYPEIELLIIDDGSKPTLEGVVREEWPNAIYFYEEQSAGCPQRRSEGFKIAKGEYILTVDDDSCPVQANALSAAVQFMQTQEAVGVLTFFIFNGQDLPEQLPSPQSGYVLSFQGGGALIRASAVRAVGGYLHFFRGEREEAELSLRLMKSGWAIYFFPSVLIHHYISPSNRSYDRAWMRAFRNKLWMIVMHFPLRRLPMEMTWIFAVAILDAVRLWRPRAFAQGIVEFLFGLRLAVQLREPMSPIVLRRYDTLRFRAVRTKEDYDCPPALGMRDLFRWFREWRNRPRQRSFWDRRDGDVGRSETVSFTHEFVAPPKERSR